MRKHLSILSLVALISVACSSSKDSVNRDYSNDVVATSTSVKSYGPKGVIVSREVKTTSDLNYETPVVTSVDDALTGEHSGKISKFDIQMPEKSYKFKLKGLRQKIYTSTNKEEKSEFSITTANGSINWLNINKYVANKFLSIPYDSEIYEYAVQSDKSGWAVAGFVCSLVGLFVPFLGILGIIFSAIGLKSSKRGLAIAGLVIGIVAVVVPILIYF